MSRSEDFNGAMRGCRNLSSVWSWKHAKRRAYERYGLQMNRRDRQELISRIVNGEGKFIPSDPTDQKYRHRVMWLIDYRDRDLLLIFDRQAKALITFLPIEKYLDRLRQYQ